MDVSIVIPTCNKPVQLNVTLACLQAQCTQHNYEVVVVNDGQLSVKDVCTAYQNIIRLKQVEGEQAGRSSARNIGAESSEGGLIIFIDDDILTDHHFIDQHIQAHQKEAQLVHGSIRELVGAALTKDIHKGGAGFPPLQTEELIRSGFSPQDYRCMSSVLEQTVEKLFFEEEENLAPWLASAGANLSIRKTTWSKLNGFDTGFGRTWGCEDLEFGYRAHQSGINITYQPNAKAYHLSHPQPDRWQNHSINLDYFISLYQDPIIGKLEHLFKQNSKVDSFLDQLRYGIDA